MSEMKPRTVTQVLTAQGPGTPVAIQLSELLKDPIGLSPSILCKVSNGAALTYSIEVTGDYISDPSYVAANGNWYGFDGMVGLTASQNGTIGGRVSAIRVNVTAFTSGTLTVSFVF